MRPEEVFLNAYFASFAQHAPLLLIMFAFGGGLALYLTNEPRVMEFGRWAPAWYIRLLPSLVVALCVIVCIMPIAFLLGVAASDAANALYAWAFFMR